VLARYARCALPMPPDPVGRPERSRARPPAHLGADRAPRVRLDPPPAGDRVEHGADRGGV